ncbi:cation:dicarboxylate symporter family transporter [Streptomyces sp. NPDC059349]|uniref:cation:dicarboxylate symporter family transporter n=1 Tax=Streptomyces sp. NPDC059349 TaxID=3346808 RepID=UPI003698B27B
MTHTPHEATPIAATAPTKPWYRQLYIQVLAAIVTGIVLGWQWPDPATSMEPIGTTFIAAMKMLIGPIVFLTIVSGNRLTEVVFKVLSFVMKAAPLGAFGAMAYAIGKFGLSTLTSLGSLILLFYVTSILFVVVVVVVVLGTVLRAYVKVNLTRP